MIFATADLALLCLFMAGVLVFTGLGLWLRRLPGRFWAFLGRRYGSLRDWNTERKLRAESLRQEHLKTALLEEQLRNEQVRTFLTEKNRREKDQ